MEPVNMTLRMDRQLKEQAENLFSDLGFNMTTAMNVFLRQSVREQRIPFEITRDVPNVETLEALEEVRRMKLTPNKKVYSDFSELLSEVLGNVKTHV